MKSCRNYSSDSQASDLPEQPRLGNLRRASGVATQLRPEYFRTAISFLYVLLVTWITAFVMVFVHDRVPDKVRSYYRIQWPLITLNTLFLSVCEFELESK